MKTILEPVKINEKPILVDLLDKYLFEMLGEKTEYKYLDSYWEKSDRHPFFIKKGDRIVGFVLVNPHTVIETDAKSIAEFYIKKEHRRTGIGKNAAFKIFDMFPGKWEIRELKENKLAHSFWKDIICEYTKGEYIDKMIDDDRWSGPVQIFCNLRSKKAD